MSVTATSATVSETSVVIEIDQVSKRFGDVQALAGVSLSVRSGEVLGLLGPNGAGKTTLIRVLSTLLEPDSGRAAVAGHDVGHDPNQVRAAIGLAGQAAAIDDLLTGRENLELVGRLYGLSSGERTRRATEVLERFDLLDAADRRVGTYSGGMRRRLDLGATLVGQPAVLLLDEPTAGLDPRSRNELWRLVEEIASEGSAVILTTQYLDEAERLADQIAVIDHGKLIALGTADELKRRVGGDVLEVRLAGAGDLAAALPIVEEFGQGAPQVDAEEARVTVSTTGGTPALLRAGRRFEDAGIVLADISLRRPSLDDVFFALTGQPADGSPPRLIDPPPSRGPDRSNVAPLEGRDRSRSGLVSAVSDTVGITKRYVLRFLRTPQLLFFGTVQPVLFVVGLDAIFGGLVAALGGVDYIQYLLPGVLVMNVTLLAGGTGVGIAEDLHAGIIDRFRSLPMARSAVLAGRTIADLGRNALAATAIMVVGFLMGYRIQSSVGGALAAVGVLFFFGYAVSWMFATIGLAVKDVQTAQFLGFAPVLPLVFLSGAWIPIASMAGAVQVFARNQPVNVTIESVRALADGTPAYHWLWQTFAWSCGILLVFGWLGTWLYKRAAA